MNILFQTIELDNFMSFGHAECKLDSAGYTLVRGTNENVIDNAVSNGSGKSSLWEALCWCLCGETARGSKDIVNRNGSDGALVKLTFKVDDHEYTVIRSKEHSVYKTNLKVYVDNVDKSGKGIRDTENLLKELLPDLTSSLLSAVIILGQGLPQRFSNNTPSGRKEVLENLSKSDFMIEDLKNRISKRREELLQLQRQYEDKNLKLETEKSGYESQQIEIESQLASLITVDAEKIKQREEELSKLLILQKDLEDTKGNLEETLRDLNNRIQINSKATSDIQSSCRQKELEQISPINEKLSVLKAKLSILREEIRTAKSIRDVCPTCGQKIIGVVRVDVTDKEQTCYQLETEIENLNKTVLEIQQQVRAQESKATTELFVESKSLTDESYMCKDRLKKTLDEMANTVQEIGVKKSQIETLKQQLFQFDYQKQSLESRLAEINQKQIELSSQILYNNNDKETCNQHLSVVSKFNNIVTRDFRGFLLSSVIDFINASAKHYCQQVFETDKIQFVLSGNNISISYDGKEYECLSGGEKQKVDLIVQFSIRNMLCKFLNFSSNILVLDEIFDNLDSKGCQKILDLVTTQLTDVESIYIITHHADIEIPYDRELNVVKNINGISELK